MAGGETFTFLARGFEFKGTLTFEGTVRIDGMVSGAIYSKGTVILGEHAVIEGNISAGTIVSGGGANGEVAAADRGRPLPSRGRSGDTQKPLLVGEGGGEVCGALWAGGGARGRA